jgi:hypothetical protein
VGPYEGVSSYQLELVVQLTPEDGDTIVGEALAGRGSWMNPDGTFERWVAREDTINF